MHDAVAYPQGMEWRCTACGSEYPSNYEPDCCQCGHPLTRRLLDFKLGEPAPSPTETSGND